MKRLEFEDYEEFACEIADKYNSLKGEDYEDVAIIAKYECTRQIIKELLCLGYNIHSIEMHDEEWDGYEAEYICSIYNDEIWCEPMLRESRYLTDDSPIMYIMDNCSSKVISHCKGKTVYEVSVEKENDETSEISNDTQNSESIYVSRAKDGTPEGFSKSWVTTEDGYTCYSSYSHYSNNPDMLKKIANDFGVKL